MQVSTVESILTNEKYKGDARHQKKFTTDYLTKTMKVNKGEVPQYYAEGSHPAIIDSEEWKKVQEEYTKSYESLTERYQALQKRYTALTKQRADKEFKADVLSVFLFELGELELLDTEWNDIRFHTIVDHITVHNDGRLVFTFRNGSEETVMM